MNVNLSNINLSRLRLGGINLSEIKLGMPSGKGSGGEETFDPASFDEAWTVTGKTNDDEDRATVKNLTGNGNDLVLSNFAFAEDSGYNSEGYLVADGVDDYIQSYNFKLGKDWTIIGDFVFLDTLTGTNSGISKPQSFYLYNVANGVSIYINGSGQSTTIASKYIKAVSSNGRIYYDDWKEAIDEKPQTVTSSSGGLFLGGTGTSFTKMAFKNLAIYNGKVLTKDQCISAYNYLQTLKAK